jgi:hypothetical protein
MPLKLVPDPNGGGFRVQRVQREPRSKVRDYESEQIGVPVDLEVRKLAEVPNSR